MSNPTGHRHIPAFGIAAPQIFGQLPIDLRLLRLAAVAAEQSGFHSIWTQSQLVGSSNVLEPLTYLSYLAAATERVELGTSAFVVSEHHPLQLAKQLASLDQLSHGRAIAVLGLGAAHVTARVGGIDDGRPVRRMLEALAVLRLLWSEPTVDYDGELWQLHGIQIRPLPVRQSGVPLWLGGRHPNALRRAARYADGWMGPGACSTDEFLTDVAALTAELNQSDRDISSFDIAKRVYLAIDSDLDRARGELVEHFASYSGDRERALQRASHCAVVGPPRDIAVELHKLASGGATVIVLNPLFRFIEQQEQLVEILQSEFGDAWRSHSISGSG